MTCRPLTAVVTLALLVLAPTPPPAMADDGMRTWASAGRPVEGGDREGQGPELVPDVYRDRFPGKGATRWYLVKRAPGTTLFLSVAYSSPEDGGQGLDVEVTTPRGNRCAHGPNDNPTGQGPHPDSFSFGANRLVSATLAVEGVQAYVPEENQPDCAMSDTLYLRVERTKGERPADLEIQYLQQPVPAENQDLREPSVVTPSGTAPAAPTARTVIGGGAFSTAPVLEPGSWTDTLRPGEQVFYRVKVQYGQSALATVSTPAAPRSTGGEGGTPDSLAVAAFAPTRGVVDTGDTGNLDGEARQVTARIPQVELANMGAASTSMSGVPGYHYLVVQLDRGQGGKRSDVPVPIRLDVQVQGTPAAAPTWATSTRTPAMRQSGAPARQTVVHGSPWPWLLAAAGVATLVGVLTGAVVAVRRLVGRR